MVEGTGSTPVSPTAKITRRGACSVFFWYVEDMDAIHITLPDGSKREFPRGVTGREIAAAIGRGLARDALAISVEGQVRDLFRPIESDASVRIHTWKDDEAKRTYWKSAAPLMP